MARSVFVPLTLQRQRRRAGKTLAEVSRDVGRSPATLKLYEAGSIPPPANVLGRLAASFDCTVADFFAESPRDSASVTA